MNECPKCKCFNLEINNTYKYFDICKCKVCGYWIYRKIEDCCRKPFTVIAIDRKSDKQFFLYRQCINCGGSVNRTNPLGAKEYGNQIRGEFDTSRFDCWKSDRENEFEKLKISKKNYDFFNSPGYKYYLYLNSLEWKDKRAQVLKRDKNMCQKCMVKMADDVHHLTYENLGNENLIDLLSVCHSCHAEIHRIK